VCPALPKLHDWTNMRTEKRTVKFSPTPHP
jgi:hypothetical protein